MTLATRELELHGKNNRVEPNLVTNLQFAEKELQGLTPAITPQKCRCCDCLTNSRFSPCTDPSRNVLKFLN